MTEIKFDPYLEALGLYIPSHNVILLHEILKEDRESYDYVLKHELKHAEIFLSDKSFFKKLFYTIKLEYENLWDIITEKTPHKLSKLEDKLQPSVKMDLFSIIYSFAKIPALLFGYIWYLLYPFFRRRKSLSKPSNQDLLRCER